MKRISIFILISFFLILSCTTNQVPELTYINKDWKKKNFKKYNEYLEKKDVRTFFNLYSNPFNEKDPKKLTLLISNYVTYKLDLDAYNEADVWQTAQYTYFIKQGDCEDNAILLCSILFIENYEAYLILGSRKKEKIDHAWVLYKDFNTNKFYYLDPTSGYVEELTNQSYYIENLINRFTIYEIFYK